MQDLATGKDRRKCCPSGSRGPVIASDGKRTEREHAKARYHCRNAEILVMGSLSRLVPGEDCRKGDDATDQHGNCVERSGQRCEDTAEQAGYAERSNSGRPAVIGFVPLAPATLQSDEKAYCQGQSEPCDERIHGVAAFRPRPSAGGRGPT